MKTKQLETITKKFSSFLKAGKQPKPDDCNCSIKLALFSDTPPKVRSREDILATAKKKIVCAGRYDSISLELADIFIAPPNSKIAEWEKGEADRLKRVAAYKKEGERVLSKAELHDGSDPDEVLEEILTLATKHGLRS